MTLTHTQDAFLRAFSRGAATALLLPVVFLALFLASPRLRTSLSRWAGHTGYSIGDRVTLPSHGPEGARLTVLLVARSNCPACQKTKRVLRSVADSAKKSGDVAIMLVSASAHSEDDLAFASGLGLADLLPGSAAPPGVKVIPAILVVDRNGYITYYHEGILDDADHREILQLIAKPRSESQFARRAGTCSG